MEKQAYWKWMKMIWWRHYKHATEIAIQSVISLVFFLGRFKTTAYLVEKEDDHVVNQREITKVLPISRNQSFTFKLQTIITSPGEEISRSIKWWANC